MNNIPPADAAFSETNLIIGAGAAGLMAAWELSAAGKTVVVVEAAERLGGRIHTLEGDGFVRRVEAGAEFVHGDLPLTLHLLRSAGIPFHPVKGKMINVRKGKWLGRGGGPEGWDELMEKMQQLGEDMPLSVFLSTRFAGEQYAALRDSVRRYAQGFDLADMHRVSTQALYKEWSQEDHDQYRIEGGYGRLIDWLAGECRRQGCTLRLSSPVEKISWGQGRVILGLRSGKTVIGGRVIVTVPLGMLQNDDGSLETTGRELSALDADRRHAETIQFLPAIDDRVVAAREMGYGNVVKILMQFSEPFWDKKEKKMGFIVSDEPVPTWWSQFPDDNPLLTAWVPGAVLEQLRGITGEELPELCLSSLASIFSMEITALRQRLVKMKMVDWQQIPYIRGGYSYETVGSPAARKILNKPLLDTLFFAGEACYEGDAPGTVEAALVSGQQTARRIVSIK